MFDFSLAVIWFRHLVLSITKTATMKVEKFGTTSVVKVRLE